MLRDSNFKSFLLQISGSRTSVEYNTHLPLTLHSKLFRHVFEHGLVLLATLIRGVGGITSTRSWQAI